MTLVEKVARAICDSHGSDPDAPFMDRHGRPIDGVFQWERWQGEANAAIRVIGEANVVFTQPPPVCGCCGHPLPPKPTYIYKNCKITAQHLPVKL